MFRGEPNPRLITAVRICSAECIRLSLSICHHLYDCNTHRVNGSTSRAFGPPGQSQFSWFLAVSKGQPEVALAQARASFNRLPTQNGQEAILEGYCIEPSDERFFRVLDSKCSATFALCAELLGTTPD